MRNIEYCLAKGKIQFRGIYFLKWFKQLSSLETFKNYNKIEKTDRMFSCDQCNYNCIFQFDLTVHNQQLHTDKKHTFEILFNFT